MVHVNVILWLAMMGAVSAPVPDGTATWTAAAGLVVAACWQHSAVRGFVKSRKKQSAGALAATGYVMAIIGGVFVALIAYLMMWFIVRNMIEGLGPAVETGGHALVAVLALVLGYSSFRTWLGRG